MRLDLSLLGWVHTLACLAALALGAVNLARRKGTATHRRIGQWYLGSIMLVSVTGLGIYRLGRFFFPHWLAIATIIFAGLAYAFAHFHRPPRIWARGHIICAVLTYYLLIAGGVNEVFIRVDAVRRMSGGVGSPINGMTHFIVMALTLVALVWFNVTINRKRLPRAGARDGALPTARS